MKVPKPLRLAGEVLPEFMVILDHDMLPLRNIVLQAGDTMQSKPDCAFVQFPQRFYDIEGSDMLYSGNEIFFDGIQINRGRAGLATFAGTNAMWRLSSLYDIGGLQYGTLTEDTQTGRAAHVRGRCLERAYCRLTDPICGCKPCVRRRRCHQRRWAVGPPRTTQQKWRWGRALRTLRMRCSSAAGD